MSLWSVVPARVGNQLMDKFMINGIPQESECCGMLRTIPILLFAVICSRRWIRELERRRRVST